jgi:hypothetical protein
MTTSTDKKDTLALSRTVTAAFNKIDKLLVADHEANVNYGKAAMTEYQSFSALVTACKALFVDPKFVKEVQRRVTASFEDNPAAAEIRNTILSNVAKVAYGGTVGSHSKGTKVTVAGKGWEVVEKLLKENSSIRDFRLAIATAKPEGLKKKGSPQQPNPGKKEIHLAQVVHKAADKLESKDAVLTRIDAMKAVLEVLKISMTVFKAGTDNRIIDNASSLEKLITQQISEDQKAA